MANGIKRIEFRIRGKKGSLIVYNDLYRPSIRSASEFDIFVGTSDILTVSTPPAPPLLSTLEVEPTETP